MRIKIALFFTLLFSISLITPTVITFVDDTQDIAFFLDMNEEEEKKGKESSKDLEIKITYDDANIYFLLKGIQKRKNLAFKAKKYASQFLKIDTPPPKLVL